MQACVETLIVNKVLINLFYSSNKGFDKSVNQDTLLLKQFLCQSKLK